MTTTTDAVAEVVDSGVTAVTVVVAVVAVVAVVVAVVARETTTVVVPRTIAVKVACRTARTARQ